MIRKISFENYKSFQKGEIEIKPITILLGANSVGKSSINQLILMLQQTALSSKYKSALRLHGEYISLGENENIFKDKDINKDLIITFEFQNIVLYKSIREEYLTHLINSLLRPLNILLNYPYISSKKIGKIDKYVTRKLKNELNKKIKNINDFNSLIDLIDEISEKINIKDFDEYDNDFLFYFDLEGPKYSESINNPIRNKNNYGNLYIFLKKIKEKIKSDFFEISFTIKNIVHKNENLLKVSRVTLKSEDFCILDISFSIDKSKKFFSDFVLKSDVFDGKEFIDDLAKKEILKNIKYDSTIFYLFSSIEEREHFYDEDLKSSLTTIILDIFYSSIKAVKQSFSRELVNYVSPLRAHPQRYYFLDKSKINLSLDTLDGDSLTEILKENPTVKKNVNSWLKKFDLFVDVSILQDVIHKLKVKQYGLNLDITDVGFGISQILPVIVQGFLSYNDSLTIIEQPEIHLHPSMQADLADLFIDIVLSGRRKKPAKFLLIETHSEYLLKRLRRRLAEKRIDKENVKVYFLYHNDEINSGVVEEKEISNTGSFEWPQNFYAGELLKDTIEFIKHQDY